MTFVLYLSYILVNVGFVLYFLEKRPINPIKTHDYHPILRQVAFLKIQIRTDRYWCNQSLHVIIAPHSYQGKQWISVRKHSDDYDLCFPTDS